MRGSRLFTVGVNVTRARDMLSGEYSSNWQMSQEEWESLKRAFWWLNPHRWSYLPKHVQEELTTWALCHKVTTTTLPKDVFKMICYFITTIRKEEEGKQHTITHHVVVSYYD